MPIPILELGVRPHQTPGLSRWGSVKDSVGGDVQEYLAGGLNQAEGPPQRALEGEWGSHGLGRVGALCWGERGAGPSTATLPAPSPSIGSRTWGTAVSRGAGHQGSSCCLCGRITDVRVLCAALPSR